MDLPKAAMPEVYRYAERLSLRAQRRFLVLTRIRLLGLVVAGVGGVVSLRAGHFDLIAAVSVLAMLTVLAAETMLITSRAEENWHDGRSIAESARAITWRFAVRARPFQHADGAAETLFLDRLNRILLDAPPTVLPAVHSSAVNDTLREVRDADLAARRDLYLTRRINPQIEYYTRRARHSAQLAHRYRAALLAIELACLGFAALRFGWPDLIVIDLTAVLTTLAAALIAWLATRRYDTESRSYLFAVGELRAERDRLALVETEPEWSYTVSAAEEAIDRELSMWRASRTR